MCGIAGIVSREGLSPNQAWLSGLLEAQRTRGPDDRGLLLANDVEVVRGREPIEISSATIALFHQRLSILDLTKAGWQPMSSEDGRFHVVYNGEIVNYKELRGELRRLGHHFVSESDTEVLLRSHIEWGSSAPCRFEGMFAYALLDTRERSLCLVRDFFGIKPLYYQWTPDGVAFASQISTVLQIAGGQTRINAPRLHDYLRYGMTDHGGETMLAGLLQVPAGHMVEIDLDLPVASDPSSYWRLTRQDLSSLSFGEAAEQLRGLFFGSIERHMRSDVRIGSALSGGVDSSSIVMAMRQLLGPQAEIHAFSYVPSDESLSEERWVDLVGAAAGAITHKVTFDQDDLLADLDYLIRIQEEPFGSLSIYAQNRVFRAASDVGVTVMLDGQGADELLGGYGFFRSARLASLIRGRRLGAAWRLATAAQAGSRSESGQLIAASIGHLVPLAMQPQALRLGGEPLMPEWLDAAWFSSRDVEPRIVTHTPESEVLRAYLERSTWELNLPHLLRYEDRNSMAFSIESRVPFLTPSIASFALSLPESYLMGDKGESKRVFRAAMRGVVPDPILDRTDKIGFEVPDARLLSKSPDLINSAISDLRAGRVRGIDSEGLAAAIDGVTRRDRSSARILWRTVNLARWARLFDVAFD